MRAEVGSSDKVLLLVMRSLLSEVRWLNLTLSFIVHRRVRPEFIVPVTVFRWS